MFKTKRSLATALTLILVTVMLIPAITAQVDAVTITVSGTPWGTSTCYIGATEGNVRFNIADLQDAGMNTYRIYGGMSRWEAQDDDGVFGSPTVAEIKANLNVINWTWWDTVMTTPPDNSDYWWSGAPGTTWQGNARTIFQSLKDANIRPVLTIRNVDDNDNPAWAAQLDPPNSTADWNEWWEHVFATVYWLNVRNDYRVDDFEVHNEPNNDVQGWGGTQADYFALVQQTKDAVNYVYTTYLPGRTYHIYAPVTTGGSTWVNDALQQIPIYFDSVDIHNYNSNITGYTRRVHRWMNATGRGSYPLWMSEWATYEGGYSDISTGLKTILNNLIRGSRPGNDYIYGSHLFTFYDWGGFNGRLANFEGLVDVNGAKRAGFYALRIGTRALNGCKTTYRSTPNNSNLLAITTRDTSGQIYLLITNGSERAYNVDANLSALITSGTGTMWQYDATHLDVIVGNPMLNNGHVSFTIPGASAILIRFAIVTQD